jgi:hypothetical protein
MRSATYCCTLGYEEKSLKFQVTNRAVRTASFASPVLSDVRTVTNQESALITHDLMLSCPLFRVNGNEDKWGEVSCSLVKR